MPHHWTQHTPGYFLCDRCGQRKPRPIANRCGADPLPAMPELHPPKPCIHCGPVAATYPAKFHSCKCGPITLHSCDLRGEVSQTKLPSDVRAVLPAWRPNYRGYSCAACPDRIGPAAVLHLICRAGWQQTAERSRYAMHAGGLPYDPRDLVGPDFSRLDAMIPRGGARAVINHAVTMPLAKFADHARQFPSVAFVVINHSSLDHSLAYPYSVDVMPAIFDTMAAVPNLFFATVDPLTCWADLVQTTIRDRVLWWPNPVALPPLPATRRPDPPAVLLTCRTDLVKAIPAQVLGMALAQRWRPRLRLAVSLSGTPQPKLLESTGAKFETWPYAEADEWNRRLQNDVSVVCQASLSESFNYVAADAIGWGRPVVGSPAIRYLPADWTCDPNNPRQVAAMILEHLDDYEARAQQARRIAVALAARQNAAYCAMIGRLCGE